MQAPKFDTDIPQPEPSTPRMFQVAIAYQDFVTGTRARHAVEHIARETGHEGEFAETMWKFDVLRLPKLRQMAAEEAVSADLIILSAHGDDELPEAVRAWAESWAWQRAGRPGGLVLLLDRLDGLFEGPRNIRAYLRRVADRANLDYFEHGDIEGPRGAIPTADGPSEPASAHNAGSRLGIDE